MKRLLLLLPTVTLIGCVAVGQTGDLGAQIAAADAALGASPGVIQVTASGTISEGQVSLSVGHDLVCNDLTTISLNAGSYLYQNSHTRIKNCIISATSTPINGEIQSINTDHVELDNVTFEGGGNLVYWVGVNDFIISDNKVVSITAAYAATHQAQSGYFLMKCSRGRVDNLVASNFVFPAGPGSLPAILSLNLSHDITINNVFISNIDASFDFGGSGIQINGCRQIVINGGVITYNAKMDGITSESYGSTTPSYGVTITGVNASYNGGPGLNVAAGLSLGDGLDIINTGHVRISNCTLLGNGYLRNEQPAIWLFLDDDVVVANSDLSDSSMGGLDLAGSQNTLVINDTINRSQASGIFAEWQAGTATNLGSKVSFVSGVSGGFGLPWRPGTPFILDGITYEIASVTDSGHVTLKGSPPSHSSPVHWGVNTNNLQIINSIIDDNGLGGFGGPVQVGIDWADSTNGIISGVTSTNTGIGAQLVGLEIDNTASAILSGDNFSGNLDGGDGIYAVPQVVSPASLSFQNQGVGTTSLAQTVTLAAGAVVLQNLLIQASSDFSETNNCGSALPAFTKCQVQLTFAPTVARSRSGTLTVTDSGPKSPQTVSLTGTGVSSGLGLSVATGGSNSATVASGTMAKYLLSIGGAGVSGTASLSCTGAPAGEICNVPATLAVSATQSSTFAVNVTNLIPATDRTRPIAYLPSPLLLALAIMGCVVLPAGVSTKRSARRYLIWLPLVLPTFLCSCGGGSPQAQNYTLTVTARLGTASEQVSLTLTVK